MMPVANQITDGQMQVQTALAPVTEFSDGQPQAPTITLASAPSVPTGSNVSYTPSLAPTVAAVPSQTMTNPSATPSAILSMAPLNSSTGLEMIACNNGFSITLVGSQLYDQAGRTGYIASNFQLQFDNPPQLDAIYTSGFSVCSNGSLALGGSNVFYQCLSGNFYNLYDRSWAAQCSPITLNAMKQVQCGT